MHFVVNCILVVKCYRFLFLAAPSSTFRPTTSSTLEMTIDQRRTRGIYRTKPIDIRYTPTNQPPDRPTNRPINQQRDRELNLCTTATATAAATIQNVMKRNVVLRNGKEMLTNVTICRMHIAHTLTFSQFRYHLLWFCYLFLFFAAANFLHRRCANGHHCVCVCVVVFFFFKSFIPSLGTLFSDLNMCCCFTELVGRFDFGLCLHRVSFTIMKYIFLFLVTSQSKRIVEKT